MSISFKTFYSEVKILACCWDNSADNTVFYLLLPNNFKHQIFFNSSANHIMNSDKIPLLEIFKLRIKEMS